MTIETQPDPKTDIDVPAADEVVNREAVGSETPYDDPEFLAGIERGTAEQIGSWDHDWSIRINALMEALDLSRMEVMVYLLLCQVGALRSLGVGFQTMFNGEPQRTHRTMENQLLQMQLEIAARELGLKIVKDGDPPTPEEAQQQTKKGWKIR